MLSHRDGFLTSFLVSLYESHIESDIPVGGDTQFVHYDICWALIPPCFELCCRCAKIVCYML